MGELENKNDNAEGCCSYQESSLVGVFLRRQAQCASWTQGYCRSGKDGISKAFWAYAIASAFLETLRR
jgi:hypothetical protein